MDEFHRPLGSSGVWDVTEGSQSKKTFFQSKKTFLPNDQKKHFLGSRKRFFLIDFDKKCFFDW